MKLAWRPREAPLVARAAVARGAAAWALARRLAALDDAALAALAGVVGADLVAVLGPADALPWVDGVAYLGRDDDAPGLLVPTTLVPTVPVALLARALASDPAARAAAPLGVVVFGDAPAVLVPLGEARPIARARLAGILALAPGAA